uniref:Uncharacterized protein n=2 Tax=Caenorhabditis japonica TaxID=281687 RepID=A0A8R1EJJ6_CAEJA
KANLTRKSFNTIKSLFRRAGILDPTPSREEIDKNEDIYGASTMFTVVETNEKNARGDMVYVAMLRDVSSVISERCQEYLDNDMFFFDDSTKQALWAFSVNLLRNSDKGDDSTKLCLAIGKIAKSNSAHHLIPLGIYNDDESAENMNKYLHAVIKQVNELEFISLTIDGEPIQLPVNQYLGGDMKFVYSMLGHEGQSAKKSCLRCYTENRLIVGKYQRGVTAEERSLASYQVDSMNHLNNIKMQSSFVFTRIQLNRVVPPCLPVLMEITERYAFTPLREMADAIDSKGAKKGRTMARRKEREMTVEIAALEKSFKIIGANIRSMEHVAAILSNCLKCSGCSGSVSCTKKAMGTIESLKRREIEEKKEIDQRRREKEEYVTSGPTRSSLQLEKVWKKYGADVCAFKQTFCGKHVYKLLHTRAINEYMLVFPPTPNRDRIRDLLLALGDVMKLCVSSALTECEMDELEDGIARIWESLQNCAPHDTITPKLHMLMEHVMPFVKEHKTWAKTCEQSIDI